MLIAQALGEYGVASLAEGIRDGLIHLEANVRQLDRESWAVAITVAVFVWIAVGKMRS